MQSNTTEQQHLMVASFARPVRLVPCMGGMCLSRQRCAHYHASSIGWREPSERLCAKDCEEPEPIK
jgi:hypothetical protein